MIIDEAKRYLEIECLSISPNSKHYMANKKAIEAMCKYQKIEQIIKDIPYGGDVTVRRIQEVVEDGKND